MELKKVILRYLDGRTVAGYAPEFADGLDPLSLVDQEGNPLRVPLGELKALFFVRTFSGNPDYDAPKDPSALATTSSSGRLLRLDFADGEQIFGELPGAAADFARGFFVRVADPGDNNLLIYINPAALARAPQAAGGDPS